MISNFRDTVSLSLTDRTSTLFPSQQLEMELTKDRWDARNIPGLQYAPHTGLYFIDFLCVPEVFRPSIKEYARFLLATGRSAGTLYNHVHYLGLFLTFFVQGYPDARTLRDLTEQDMCKFVELSCFHCPACVLTPDDLLALEIYEQQILERIEIGKQAGNVHWIEVNQKNLDERVRPAIVLLKQGHIVAKTDKQEREYTDEEWRQRHHQRDWQETNE